MNVREMALRYGTSEQNVRKILRRWAKELNDGGEHLTRRGHSWELDSEGLRRLDAIRGYKEPTIELVEESTPPEIELLRAENQRLMNLLVASQAEIIRLQKEMLSLKEPTPSLLERIGRWFRKGSEE